MQVYHTDNMFLSNDICWIFLTLPESYGTGEYYDFVEQKPTQSSQQNIRVEDESEFQKLFLEELQQRHRCSYIKQWTQEEDAHLLRIGHRCSNWKQLSRQFNGKTAKVCQRRFKKLINKQQKWPKEEEEAIKYLREVEGKSWVQIEMVIKKYNAKKIRERYKNYLEVDVNRKKWSIQEDLRLWAKVSEMGKVWKQISTFFPDRSGLQLRNRHYKFLEPALEKVKALLGQ